MMSVLEKVSRNAWYITVLINSRNQQQQLQ